MPAATISYAGTPFCTSLVGAQSVTQTGTAGGTYSSTAGLTINAATGAITPSTSTAGTYTVTYTMAAGGGCAAQTATTSVTITTLPAATISYAGSPYCTSLVGAQAVTQTGTAGGTYSSTAGLTINAATGAITPSTSTAGTYTVTYTMAAGGGCAAQTATTSVTITALPVATFSYAGTPYCQNAANPSPTFSGGGVAGTFSSTAGLVFVSTATGQINLSASTPGTYTVTNTIAASGGCAAVTATSSITITTLPVATISYAGTPFCTSLVGAQAVTQTGTAGGTYSSTAGLTINAATGAITPSTSTAGTYTVTYTMAAAGGCAAQTATTSVTITTLPAATISYAGTPFCTSLVGAQAVTQTGTAGGTYSSTAGLTINAATGAITPSTSTPGTYTVTYTMAAAGGCAAQTATTSVTITTLPVATFSYAGTPYCQNAANPSPTFSGGGVAGTFSSTAGLVFVSTATGQINLSASTPGTYTVTNTIAASGGCAAVTATSSVTITALPVATFSYAGTPYCQNAANPSPTFSGGGVAGTFSSTAGLVFVSTATGQINLSASTAGTYTVTNTIAASGGCAAVTATSSITITALPVATFSYAGTPYCQNAANPSPTFSGGGVAGTFSSTAGLVFVSTATGQINLSASTAGTYTVTNTIAASGGCTAVTATSSITITTLPAATISYAGSPFCTSLVGAQTVTQTGTAGGTYSSTAGLTINAATGAITPSTSTAGTYTVTYTMAAGGGCAAQTATTSVTITTLPAATISYAGTPFCSSLVGAQAVTQTGTAGGTYSSTAGLTINAATGAITPSTSTAGTYTVTYTMAAAGGCAAQTATTSVTITALPVATFSYAGTPYCQNAANPSPTFSGGGVAGTFSSTAGLVFVSTATGHVDLSASTPGTYTVTNTIAASGGCAAVTATSSITITALPVATFSYSGTPYCKNAANPSPTFSGGGVAGTFSSTAGLVFVSTATGQINLSASTPGTYTVTNTIAASSGCAAVTATSSVTITTLPAATISYAGTPFCTSLVGAQAVTQTGTSGGTYSSTAGLTINAATGAITPSTSTAGTYTVTYTMAAGGGCAAQTATTSVTITTLPVATFSYTGTPYCQNAADPSPTFSGGGVAGTFSSTAGLVFVSTATGQINLSASTAGTYTVTNTIAASGGCAAVTATTSITITTLPVATFSYTGTPYCQNAANPNPTFSGGGVAGTFSSTAGLVFVSTATGQINLSASTPGTYTVMNTIAASGGCAAVTATSSVTITTLPAATISYAGSPFCTSLVGVQTVTQTGTSGGTYSSTAGLTINAATGAITSGTSTAGTYTVTYTMAAGGGCAAQTATTSVTITTLPVATFSYAGTPYCQNAANPSPTFSGGGVAGTFSSTAGLVFVSTATGQINLSASTAGTYTVTNTIAASGGCAAVTATSSVTITALPVATFSYAGTPYCQNAANPSPTFSGGSVAGTFSSTAGLVFVSTATGQINLSASTAGTYTVTNTIAASAGCAAVTATSSVTITALPVASFSYAGTPYCQNAANPSPTFSGGGVAGTFSSTAGLVFVSTATGQVDLSASTAGTYNVTNTIAASSGCAAVTATSSITIAALPVATFSYAGTPYCQNAANPSPTFSGGGVAGTFSSTAGLVFVSAATGQINLSASTAGTYTVTNTIAASSGCAAVTATSSVTITTLPAATISYAGTPFCTSLVGAQAVTLTGTAGGTYSSTAGLAINAATGAITPSTSTAGTYTVTYTMAAAGGCAAQTATTTVTITTLPVATFSYAGTPYCQNAANPSPTFSGGGVAGTFSSTAGLVFLSTATGQINLSASTPGTYTVTNTIAASGGCAAVTATSSIIIGALPVATFSYAGTPYCQNAANPSPTFSGGGVAGTFSSTAGLVFVSTATGQVDLSASTAGTYTVTNTIAASGGCAAVTATSSVTITTLPAATISYAGSPFCTSLVGAQTVTLTGTAGGTYSSTAGLTINAATGAITPGTSTAGTYTVTYTMAAGGGCAAQIATTSVTISTLSAATISYAGSPFCTSLVGAQSVTQTGTAGGTYSSTVGLTINAATGAITPGSSTAGTYTVTYTMAAAGGCAAQTATTTVTITTLPAATISYAGTPFCTSLVGAQAVTLSGTAGGTYSSTAGLTINAATGAITPSSSTAGTYTVTYTMAAAGGCAAQTATASVTITALPVATFSYAGTPYCQNAAIPSPTFSGGGVAGSFSSTAGLVFVSTATGQINLSASTPGTYTVTNTIAASGGCAAIAATSSVTITALPVATFSYTGTPYCQNAANPSPAFSGGGLAGTFSSTAGLVFVSTATGQVDLSASTAGTYTVTNTIAASGGCAAVTATSSITITTLPAATISYAGSPFCTSLVGAQSVTQTGTAGGTYSSTAGLTINAATGAITPSSSTAGSYTVTYTMAAGGGCSAQTATTSVTITALPVATFSYAGTPYCQNAANPSPTFSGGGVAGTFSSTAGLVFVSTATGQINLSASTAGTYTVTNTISASGGCAAVTATSSITITALPVATFSYTGTPYCQNAADPSPTFSGGGVAGTFSSTAGLVFVSTATGQINLSASTAGTYTVTNTIAASGGCAAVTATTSITITTLPVATFSYTGTPYCQNAANPNPTFSGGGVAGTFSSTAGLVFVSTATGQINLSASTPGTYTVMNTIAASGGCAAVTATSSITITALPVATFSYAGTPYCQNAANPNPTFSGGGVAGTFSSTAGLVFVSTATGQINLSASTAGTYTVTNTIAASGGCAAVTATSSITITTLPAATISYAGSPFCTSLVGSQAVTQTGTVGGTYSSTAGLTINAATGAITPSTSTAGTYTVTYTMAAAGGCAAQTATTSVTVTTLPAATISYAGSPYCTSLVGAQSVTQTGTAGGTYSSTAGLTINAATGAITPSSSTAGTYTVTYTMAAGGGCAAQTATASVTITTLPVATFGYAGTPYCQNAANPSPTFSGGGVAGTFSSTVGLVFVSTATGQINLSASTAGTYTVTNTIAASGGCAAVTATSSVTITTLPAATISYAGSPFCTSLVGAQAVTQTGTAGGTYSSTAGLTINAATGAITPSTSTAGTYTVTYTMAAGGGCAAQTATTTVTIVAVPTVVITNPTAVCAPATVDLTAAAVTTGSTAGLTYTYFTDAAGTLVLANANAIAASGTYYIKGTTAGGCASAVMPVVVTVTPVPTVVITNPAAMCAPGTVDLTAPAVTAGSTAGLSYTYFTDAGGTIALGTPNAIGASGTYYIKGTTAGGCASAVIPVVVVINVLPSAVITYSGSPYCATGTAVVTQTGQAGGTYSAPAGIAINASTGDIDLVTSTPGTYTITYSFTNLTCTNTATASITINALPVASINYLGSPYCGVSGVVNVTQTGLSGGIYSSTAGLSLNSSTGDIDLGTSTAGTYTVTYNFTNGTCSNIATTSVTINAVPPATISYSGNPYCNTGTAVVTQTGQNGGTYTSTPGLSLNAVTGAVDLATSTPGTYTVTYSFGNGTCTNTTTNSIIINPKPTVVINSPAAVCAPGTVDLTAAAITAGSTAGLTYTYFTDAAGTLVLANANAVAVSGTYYIVGTSAAGCSDIQPVVVTIDAKPAVVINSPAAVCAPGTVDLTAAAITAGSTAGLTYTYFTDAAGTIALGTPNAVATSGTYYIVGTSAAGCSDIQPVVVTIDAKPAVVINNPAATCAPGTVDLTAAAITAGSTAGLTYTYFTDAAGTIALGTPNAVATSGTYYIVGTSAAGCSDIQPVVVTIDAKPTVVINTPAAICAPGTVDLTAAAVTAGSTAGLTYTYFTDAAGTIALGTPSAVATSGTYYIVGTSAAGCSDIQPVVVTIDAKPTVVITNPAAVCAPGTVDLTAAAVTAGSTAGLTYTYFTDAAGTIALGTPNAVATSGTYYIVGTSAAGCSDIQPVVVTIDAKPTVVINSPAAICAPGTVDLTAAAITAGSTAGLTYTYFTDAAGTIALGTPNAVATSGTYFIVGTSAAGCSDIQPVVVTIDAKPAVVINSPAAVCAPGTVDLTAAAITAGSTAGLTYTYFTDAAGTLVLANANAVATSGTYYVVGTSAAGCSDIQPVVVTIDAKPTVVINNPAATCAPSTVDLTAAAVTAGSTAGLTYTYFTDAAGTIALGTPNAVATNGTYYIVGTSAAGCSDIQPVVVTIDAKPAVVINSPAAVCAPGTVDLTAAAVTAGSTAGLTYTYFTDAAGTLVLANANAVAVSGTYYIVGTSAAGCSDIQPVVVTIDAKPTVVINNPAAVCAPGTVDLTTAAITAGSTAGLTYTYFTDAAGTLVLANPNAVAVSGTYYIVGTSAAGCSDIQPVVVTIDAKPTVVITNPAAMCAPGTVDLTAAAITAGSTAGLTYTYFTDAAGTIALGTPNAVATSGTYYIVGTIAAGCSDIQSVVVTIDAKPAVVINNPAATCAPGTVDLTAAAVTAGSTAGLTYTYFTDAAGTLVLANANAVAVSGTYYIVGTSAAGCSDIQPVVVTIDAKPTVVINNPAAVCAPGTVDLTAAAITAGSTAGLTYTYFTDAAGTLVLANANAVAVSGTYYIVGTSAAGCSDIQPVVVTIDAKPAVVINNPAAVCAPATVDLTAAAVTAGSTAGLTYAYFTDAAGTLVLANANAVAVSGTYYIVGTSAAGCSDIQPVVVTIDAKPTVVINNPAAVCAPGTVDLTAAAVTAGSTAGLTYTYFTDAAGTLVLANANAVAVSGTYYIVGTSAAGCSDIQPVVVTIDAKPAVVINSPAAVCAPGTVDLTAAAITAGSTAGLTYTYFTDAAGTLVLANANAVAVSGTYYIVGTSAAGCSDIQPVVVTIDAKPAVVINNPAAVCAPGTVDLTAAAITAGSTAGLTYTYFTDAAGTIALGTPNAVATSGTYYIVGTSAAGCSDIQPVVVTIDAKPTVVINNPAAVCAPGTVDLTAAAVTAGSTAGLTYTYFTDAAGTIALGTPNAVATSGTYYIVGTSAAGCSDIQPVVVTINAKPTVVINNPAAVAHQAPLTLLLLQSPLALLQD